MIPRCPFQMSLPDVYCSAKTNTFSLLYSNLMNKTLFCTYFIYERIVHTRTYSSLFPYLQCSTQSSTYTLLTLYLIYSTHADFQIYAHTYVRTFHSAPAVYVQSKTVGSAPYFNPCSGTVHQPLFAVCTYLPLVVQVCFYSAHTLFTATYIRMYVYIHMCS